MRQELATPLLFTCLRTRLGEIVELQVVPAASCLKHGTDDVTVMSQRRQRPEGEASQDSQRFDDLLAELRAVFGQQYQEPYDTALEKFLQQRDGDKSRHNDRRRHACLRAAAGRRQHAPRERPSQSRKPALPTGAVARDARLTLLIGFDYFDKKTRITLVVYCTIIYGYVRNLRRVGLKFLRSTAAGRSDSTSGAPAADCWR
eukprot:SAG22_NODE_855_length_6843_cov_3.865658_2_plen_202_part_00